MSATRTSKRTVKKTIRGMSIEDAPIAEGVAYLMETYQMREDEAREMVLIAKGAKQPGGRVADE
jgi:hypothetical protein